MKVVGHVDLGVEDLPGILLDRPVHLAQSSGRYSECNNVGQAHRNVPRFHNDPFRRKFGPKSPLVKNLCNLLQISRPVMTCSRGELSTLFTIGLLFCLL
jgi:hypothetical protein